jgi:hypothetical protein
MKARADACGGGTTNDVVIRDGNGGNQRWTLG